MKVLTLIAIYIASFICIYMMLSAIGFIFGYGYLEVLHMQGWQVCYCLIIGPWFSIFPAREYYMKHESYLDKVTR